MIAVGLLDALGVRVRRVEDLAEGAVWVQRQRLLLIDFDLSAERTVEAVEEILPSMIPDTIDFD